FLDGIRLLESIEHGCVPIQFMGEQHLEILRSELPAWAGGLIRGLHEVERGLPEQSELQALYLAAVQLVAMNPSRAAVAL
ncbi:MAG: hypothetical protein WD029_09530, partial [Microthrixaceae bacterium]